MMRLQIIDRLMAGEKFSTTVVNWVRYQMGMGGQYETGEMALIDLRNLF